MDTDEKDLSENAEQKELLKTPAPLVDDTNHTGKSEKKEGTAINVGVVKFAIKYLKFVGVALGIWFMGWLGLSYVWVLCGLLIYVTWKLNKEEREKKKNVLKESAEMSADGAVPPRMEDLPSWVRLIMTKTKETLRTFVIPRRSLL